MRNPLRKGRWLRETMTDLHATNVPLATDTYIATFVPLGRIDSRDLAAMRWIGFGPPPLAARDEVAKVREVGRAGARGSRRLATWIALVHAKVPAPDRPGRA